MVPALSLSGVFTGVLIVAVPTIHFVVDLAFRLAGL